MMKSGVGDWLCDHCGAEVRMFEGRHARGLFYNCEACGFRVHFTAGSKSWDKAREALEL